MPLPLKVYISALTNKVRRLAGKETDPYLPLPKGTCLSPHQGVEAAYQVVERKLGFNSDPELNPEDWQKIARAKLSGISGYLAERDTPTVTKSLPPEEIEPGIIKHSFYLRIRPDTDLPVHLIYKRDLVEPAPVFIHLAGSTSGVHLGWGATKVPIDHQRLDIGADMARQAAKRGYLALAIEQAGYGERGERSLAKRSGNRTVDLANHLLILGRTLMGDGASDISSAIDWIIGPNSPKEADPNRITLFGHSAGGTLAQYAAALDTRISGVVASGSVGPIRETIGARGSGGGDGIIPGFLTWFDSADLIALVAPRPYIGLSGRDDHIFPASGIEKVVGEAQRFYARMEARNQVQAITTEGPHRYYAEASWQAIEKFIDPVLAEVPKDLKP